MGRCLLLVLVLIMLTQIEIDTLQKQQQFYKEMLREMKEINNSLVAIVLNQLLLLERKKSNENVSNCSH